MASIGQTVACLWLLIAALCWQNFVTDTHVHWGAGTDPVAAAQVSSKSSDPSPGDEKKACPACREVAASGAALLPPPVRIAVPPAAYLPPEPAPIAAAEIAGRSHAWLSRGPPENLQN